jgi:hypothetical protein
VGLSQRSKRTIDSQVGGAAEVMEMFSQVS